MSKKSFKADLSVSSIQNLITQIESYKIDLKTKCKTFCSELADIGIAMGELNNPSRFVFFGKRFENNTNGCKAIMFGSQTTILIQRWIGKDGEPREEEVSPLLMVEFGSGMFAEDTQWFVGAELIGGRGTFPNQTHAFDSDGWSWMDENGEWHHSYGVEPSRPMYYAWLEMYSQIEEVGKRVFGR